MQAQCFTVQSVILAIVAALGLSSCDRPPDGRTVGEQTGAAIDKLEKKTDQAIDAGAAKLKDAEITTSVNATLARDESLSALKINVDTKDGHVSLRGTAPDAASRDRATQLAQSISGVISVDNQLQIAN